MSDTPDVQTLSCRECVLGFGFEINHFPSPPRQEYIIIEGRESILLYYGTMYQLFTRVSDLCNVIHKLRFRVHMLVLA